jgi:uncharacterized protein
MHTSLPLLLALTLLAGCSNDPASQPASPPTSQPAMLPTTQMTIGSGTYTIEIARSDPDRTRGLMGRESLASDHGMIFLFATEQRIAFWMKNVPFPLDIVFLDSGGKVVDMKRMLPFDLRQVWSDVPARYAIELAAGAVKDNGLKIGDRITIPVEAKADSR